MTTELFRDDSYLTTCEAVITAIDGQRVQTDRSVFYATGGGQPGDTGTLGGADGNTRRIIDTVKERDSGEHWHVLEDATGLAVGNSVSLTIDWQRRHRFMRFHSCLHMLCSLIDAPVTSGSIQENRARLDFDLPEPLDKEALTEELNALIRRDIPMTTRAITNAELDAQPELVRTLSVQPPRNASGTIRLVEFEGVDLQPCGGTHVRSTAEIGPVRISKIEKKGRQNRRIIVVFDEA